jgi:hypothetical protein
MVDTDNVAVIQALVGSAVSPALAQIEACNNGNGTTPVELTMSMVNSRDGNLGLFDQDSRWTEAQFHHAS